MVPGASHIAGAAVEFAERGVEQVIMPQRRIPAGFVQRGNARVWALDLGHDNRPVEQINRGAMDRQQAL